MCRLPSSFDPLLSFPSAAASISSTDLSVNRYVRRCSSSFGSCRRSHSSIMDACSFSSSRLCARILLSSLSPAASMRWSYQSTASSSSMIETTARWRSMVAGLRTVSLSCREPLLPAMRFNLLGCLSVTSVRTGASGVPSRERREFFALSALALGPALLYYWLAVHHSYVRAPVHPSAVGLPNRRVRICERLALVAARLASAAPRRDPAEPAGGGGAVPALAPGPECRAGAGSRERARGRYRCLGEHGLRRGRPIAPAGSRGRFTEWNVGEARRHVRGAPVQLRADNHAAGLARIHCCARTADAHRRLARPGPAKCRQHSARGRGAVQLRRRERRLAQRGTPDRARLVRRTDSHRRRGARAGSRRPGVGAARRAFDRASRLYGAGASRHPS